MSGAQPLYCQTKVCVCLRRDNVCCLVCLQSYRSNRVSTRVHSSARLVSRHLSGYTYRGTNYLSDVPEASQCASHSESQGFYQICID